MCSPRSLFLCDPPAVSPCHFIFRKSTAPLPSSYTESPDELGSAPEVSISASHIHNVRFSRNHSKKNKEKQPRLILISLKLIFTHLAVPRLCCCLWGLVPRPGIEPRPLRWELRFLASRPPGESLTLIFLPESTQTSLEVRLV